METPEIPPSDEETARELARLSSNLCYPSRKWLIGGSLALGAVLLGVLLWISRTYFPVG